MKKTVLILLQIFIIFVFSGCSNIINNSQTTDPIGVCIQQLGKTDSVIKIMNKDEINIFADMIQSIRWGSDTTIRPNPDGYFLVTFQYNSYNKNNKLGDDNPYKIWINDDKSIYVENFRGKTGTISKEELSKYDLPFKYLKPKE